MTDPLSPSNVYNLQFKAKTVNLISDSTTSSGVAGKPSEMESSGPKQIKGSKSNASIESDSVARFQYEDGTFSIPKNDQTGWVSISANIDIYTTDPIRPGKKVYLGRQKHFGDRYRDVVIKMLAKSEKTEGEVVRLLTLDHPNIVRVIETGEHFGTFPEIFIAMEYCPSDLQDYVDKRQDEPFDFDRSFSYSKQLTKGVSYIHHNNIVHRDLKPPNILISNCEKYVKVSDFGLSKAVPDGKTAAPVTNSSDGTEGFKAPELYEEKTEYSYSADVFSLGINIYFIFTNGKHPFGSNSIRRASNIMDNKNRDLSQIPEFPKPFKYKQRLLQDALEAMMQHKPRDRPTVEEILNHEFFTDAKVKANTTKTVAGGISQPKDEKQILESELKRPLNEVGFKQAVDIIDRLQELRGSEKFEDLLKLAECELHLNRGREEDSVKRVKNFIADSKSSFDIREMGFQCQKKGDYIYAMILYKISHGQHKTQNASPDDGLRWIRNHLVDISCTIKPLIQKESAPRNIAVSGFQYMKSLLNEFLDVKGGEKELRVLMEAGCLVSTSSIAADLKDYAASVLYGQKGVSLLESHFRKNASSYKDYGVLLNNIGTAYYFLEQYPKAENYYLKAIDALLKSVDFENVNDKENFVDGSKNHLALTRKYLKK